MAQEFGKIGHPELLARLARLLLLLTVYTAQTYGRVIISELSVPIHYKTIKPTSIGGTAGGEKYIVNGILFKFALDFNGIYGGDENAAKAAGHDLKVRRICRFFLSAASFYNIGL